MKILIEGQKIELQNIFSQKKELETKSLNLCLDILKANNNSIRLDEESINYESIFNVFDESAEKIITYLFAGAEFCPKYGLLILGIRSDNAYIDCDDIRDIRPDEIESMDFAMIAEYLINYISNKQKDYSYNQIETFANENGYSIEDYGRERIGENFLVLSHNDKDITISFMLSGVRSNEYVYQCVYTDLNN